MNADDMVQAFEELGRVTQALLAASVAQLTHDELATYNRLISRGVLPFDALAKLHRLPRKTKKAYRKPVWRCRQSEQKRLRKMGLIDPRTGR